MALLSAVEMALAEARDKCEQAKKESDVALEDFLAAKMRLQRLRHNVDVLEERVNFLNEMSRSKYVRRTLTEQLANHEPSDRQVEL